MIAIFGVHYLQFFYIEKLTNCIINFSFFFIVSDHFAMHFKIFNVGRVIQGDVILHEKQLCKPCVVVVPC